MPHALDGWLPALSLPSGAPADHSRAEAVPWEAHGVGGGGLLPQTPVHLRRTFLGRPV